MTGQLMNDLMTCVNLIIEQTHTHTHDKNSWI